MNDKEVNELLAECLRRDTLSRQSLSLLRENEFLEEGIRLAIDQILRADKRYGKTYNFTSGWQDLVPIVVKINDLESQISEITDTDLRKKNA